MALSFEINPYVLLTFFITLGLFIYRYMTETYTVLQNLGFPGPKPVWVFGNVLEFKNKNVLDMFAYWRKIYGDVYGFYEGFRAGVVVTSPEMAKDILSKHFDKFYIRTTYRPFVYYPDNLRLISLNGDHWKNQRSVLNKMMSSTASMKQVVNKVQKASASMLEAIKNEHQACKEGLNISSFVDKFTSEVVIRIVVDMNDVQLQEHGDTIFRYEKESNWSASADNETSGLARLFPSLTPLLKRADKKHKEVHDEVLGLLRDYLMTHQTSENNNATKETDHSSFLSYLNSSKTLSRDIDGSLTRRELSTDETIAHILSLLSEMYATTTAVIQFMLYELARNPECQDKMVEEINTVFEKDDKISLSKLVEMEYFEKFFSETYRLHPIAPGISRTCAEDCSVQGYEFKKGFVVRIMTSPLYKDESIFPHPEKFDPERFSTEHREERHQYSFLPFGQGPRMCPGQKLALAMVKVAIASILRHYQLSTDSETEIPLQTALRPSLSPKNGVHISLTPRQ